MAAKTNTSAEQIDKSSFFWVGRCGICHPGGGPGEFDRYGLKYYNPRTKQFGFEAIGLKATDVGLDGDYTFVAGSGVARPAGHPTPPAAWDKTWTSESDCLLCHSVKRDLNGGKNMNWIWRTATIRAMAGLQDSDGKSVPAFMAAATAAQGWFDNIELAPPQTGVPPTATKLDINYNKGVERGQLKDSGTGNAVLRGNALTATPSDGACWGCHVTPDLKKRGRIWFDKDADVHYRWLSKQNDDDPSNDIAPTDSKACTTCHTSKYDHQITKGDPFEGTVAANHKYVDFLSCRDCHAAGNAYNAPQPTSEIHRNGHLDRISCQVCHIPYKKDAAQMVVDNAVTGKTIQYLTSDFLSADPGDPTNADKSRWYPSFHVKEDSDGKKRLFPAKLLNTVWWGAWYPGADKQANTTDDFVRPVPLWRIRKVTGGAPLTGATDDNKDGKVEVNRLEEIRLYIGALRSTLGVTGPNAPTDYVLVKGSKIWWLQGDAKTGTVQTLALHHHDPTKPDPKTEWLGKTLESATAFSMDHNVLAPANAISDCASCHRSPSPNLLGRRVLVDPFGPLPDARPIYEDMIDTMEREGFKFFGR